MGHHEDRPLTIAAAIHRHVLLFKETVLPWQTISGLSWLLAGVFCCGGPVRIFSDWSFAAVAVAATAARFSGMCWNRLIDWQIDARNPRTSRRALPSGRLSPKELAAYALLTLVLFLSTCFLFPPAGRWMGVGVALGVLFYSFAKRITCGCHFFLGLIHACLPIAGAVWQCGSITIPSALLSVAAFAAVSGTDILYALQDELFDRRFGLYSIPARFGAKASLEIASTLHVICCIAITFALLESGIAAVGFILWGICMISVLVGWHSIWEKSPQSLSKAFPFLLVGFSLATFIILSVDRAWKALS
jgi:4-hydroxybenzoate polyprenyltransferase